MKKFLIGTITVVLKILVSSQLVNGRETVALPQLKCELNLSGSHPKTQNSCVRVKGKSLCIPPEYYSFPPDAQIDQNGITIRAVLPRMSPQARSETSMTGAIGQGGWGCTVQVMYGAIAHSDMQTVYRAYAWQINDIAPPNQRFGLIERQLKHPFIKRDLFIDRSSNGIISSVMVCSGIDDVPYPSCRRYFIYEGEILSVIFDRRLVAEWKYLDRQVKSLLDHFGLSHNK